MKIAPIQGDFLVKIALGAAVIGALYYLAQQAKSSAATAINDAAAWAANVASTKLNPASDQNVVYAPISAGVTALSGQDNSLGTWLRGFTSNDDQNVRDMLTGTVTQPTTAIAPDQALGTGIGGFYSQPGALY